MDDGEFIAIIAAGMAGIFLITCIIAGILRWAFRINRSIYLLEQILQELRTPTKQPTTQNGIILKE